MKIEEAMVYLLATSQHGMKTEQIARELELRGLVPRRPGRPVSYRTALHKSKKVYDRKRLKRAGIKLNDDCPSFLYRVDHS